MRGFPPIQILLLTLGFILVAVPLARLTGNAPISMSTETPDRGDAGRRTPAFIVVRFAHPPKHLEVRQGEKVLLSAEAPDTSPLEFSADVICGPNAPEFFIEAQWPDGTPETALGLEVSPDGFEVRGDTRWSLDGAMNRVFQLSWR
ncbi:MAG: hypothetical protein ACR2OZ_06025 [Verrucomicrobiales bacterium]